MSVCFQNVGFGVQTQMPTNQYNFNPLFNTVAKQTNQNNLSFLRNDMKPSEIARDGNKGEDKILQKKKSQDFNVHVWCTSMGISRYEPRGHFHSFIPLQSVAYHLKPPSETFYTPFLAHLPNHVSSRSLKPLTHAVTNSQARQGPSRFLQLSSKDRQKQMKTNVDKAWHCWSFDTTCTPRTRPNRQANVQKVISLHE